MLFYAVASPLSRAYFLGHKKSFIFTTLKYAIAPYQPEILRL